MPRELKLERIEIRPVCRTVKDWFPTRESAEAVIPAILAHIKATGRTYDCFCHTHTPPPEGAVPVYIGEFSLPDRFLKAKRFSPCPCCWPEVGKFGHGRIAWFRDERVIRLIGEDCFQSLNPEAHRQARSIYEAERERRRTTEFLLSNAGNVPRVLNVIREAVPVAKAIELFHDLLHDRFKTVALSLRPWIGSNGELSVWLQEEDFRRETSDQMYTKEVSAMRPFAILQGFEMVTRAKLHFSNVLERCTEQLMEYDYGPGWRIKIAAFDDEQRAEAADTLSKAVKAARDILAKMREVRRFTEPIAINTLRNWGSHRGCPIPFNYSHNGSTITFGPSDYKMVGVPLSSDLQLHIGEIEFWTPMEHKRR